MGGGCETSLLLLARLEQTSSVVRVAIDESTYTNMLTKGGRQRFFATT